MRYTLVTVSDQLPAASHARHLSVLVPAVSSRIDPEEVKLGECRVGVDPSSV
jgi:hypothetical protein